MVRETLSKFLPIFNGAFFVIALVFVLADAWYPGVIASYVSFPILFSVLFIFFLVEMTLHIGLGQIQATLMNTLFFVIFSFIFIFLVADGDIASRLFLAVLGGAIAFIITNTYHEKK